MNPFDRGADGVTVGVVEAVNDDGTVTVSVRGGLVESLPADPAYAPRTVGDRVEVRLNGGLAYVLGKRAGTPPAATPAWTFETAATSPGTPFVEVVAVFLDEAGRRIRLIRPNPGDPGGGPTQPGRLEHAATAMGTYRDGNLVGDDRAEQGTWAGYGPHTGLFVYGPGAWAPLSGKTIQSVEVDLHRMNRGGIIAAVPITVGLHAHATLPSSAGPGSLASLTQLVSLRRNQSATVDLDISWGEALRDGDAAGLGIYDASRNAELDRATVTITYI